MANRKLNVVDFGKMTAYSDRMKAIVEKLIDGDMCDDDREKSHFALLVLIDKAKDFFLELSRTPYRFREEEREHCSMKLLVKFMAEKKLSATQVIIILEGLYAIKELKNI